MDTRTDLKDLARRSLRLMEQWDEAEAQRIVHPDCVNHESPTEPPAARGRGPAAIRATQEWLHAAYSGLHWQVEHLVAEDDMVVARVVMSGRQTGPFVTYDANGDIDRVFAATGKSFAVTQTHPVPDGRRRHDRALGQP